MGWGLNPESVEAGASLLGVVFSVIAGLLAWHAYRDQQRAREAAEKSAQEAEKANSWVEKQVRISEEARARAQAESVAAWATIEDGTPVIWVSNASTAPVTVKWFFFQYLTGQQEPDYAAPRRLIPPTQREPTRVDLTDGKQKHWKPIVGKHASQGRSLPPMVVFPFSDTEGRWWKRDAHGTLSELPREPEWAEWHPKAEVEGMSTD